VYTLFVYRNPVERIGHVKEVREQKHQDDQPQYVSLGFFTLNPSESA
jgi:hypothetical protein